MEPKRNTFLTTQPGKAIWTLIALTFNAARLPLWLLFFLPQSLRQHPKWSYLQAIRVRVLRAFLYNAALVEIAVPLTMNPGKEADRFVSVSIAPQKYYTGVVTRDPEIQPWRVGGTWYPSAPKTGAKPTRVILHFHGGAFVLGDGRTADAGWAAKTLVAQTPASHVFCPQYRLASNPGGRFPAAVQDAITCYYYLLHTVGVPASNIVLSGDSAGGNIALSLMRYIADHGAEVDLPSAGAATLWSPWVNPMAGRNPRAVDMNVNSPTDYLNGHFSTWGTRCYAPAPGSGIELSHPNISFEGHAFKTETPIYISTGECEVLLGEDIGFAEEMKRVDGNRVELSIEEYAPHDIILTAPVNGFEKEAERAARRAGEFLRKFS